MTVGKWYRSRRFRTRILGWPVPRRTDRRAALSVVRAAVKRGADRPRECTQLLL